MNRCIKPNQVWKNNRGNIFKIICIAFEITTQKRIVVYSDSSNNNLSMPLERFLTSADNKGNFIFSEVDYAS